MIDFVIVLVSLCVGFYLGRKTTVLSALKVFKPSYETWIKWQVVKP